MFSYYGPLCTELYDFTKPVGKSLDGDIEYYTERLQQTDGKILEAAVGSGRFLIPLLEAGFIVDGMDYSPEMLQSCRQRCEQVGLTPTLYEAKLQDFSLPERYEAIIIPTGSFCLIDEREDAIAALQNFYNHLVPNGKLIVDLQLPADWKDGEITTSTYLLPSGDGITLESKSIQLDWLQQTTETYLTYEKWRNGQLIQTELQRFAMRWYGIEEFRLILEKIGFQSISCSANYIYGQQPTSADQIITFEASR
ncbi:class I SAM-dependent methyltransferase [Paenibacillus yanchengensis]|uniref:Class I SAM-dependent methyltransferase n=1 Tax=Paenibacillus yanchengensis TaxID=2035833 RepID=A0ABW4YJL4_9BACL